jgi:Leucine-rich repeat (LRR) protein
MGTIMVPHVDDDPRACGLLRNITETGESLADKVVLIRRGSCPFALKVQNLYLTGAAGVIIHGCSTLPPYLCAGGLSEMSGSKAVSIPSVFIRSQHGFSMYNYLARRQGFIRYKQQQSATSPSPSPFNATFSLITEDFSNYTMADFPPLRFELISTGPMVAQDRWALQHIAAAVTMTVDDQNYGELPPWSDVATLDPCLSRLAGIYCENGRVVSISLENSHIAPTLPSQGWANLTALRVLWIPNNQLSGPIPISLCYLTALEHVEISTQMTARYDGFTTFPDCFGAHMPNLTTVRAASNALTNIPSALGASNPRLTTVDFSSNRIATLPENLALIKAVTHLNLAKAGLTSLPNSFPSWNWLKSLDISQNSIRFLPRNSTSNTGTFEGWQNITSINLSDNKLEGVLPVDTFDGCLALVDLDVSRNQLEGPLPMLRDCANLQTIKFDTNKFGGTVPREWIFNCPKLITISASHNRLVSPMPLLNMLNHLENVDFSYNLLTSSTLNQPAYENNVGTFLSAVCGPSTAIVKLQNNQLAGSWETGWLGLAQNLSQIYLSNNRIEKLPSDVFAHSKYTTTDVSNNNISYWPETDEPRSGFLFLDIRGNPSLTVSEYPEWVVVKDEMVQSAGSPFLCPRLSSRLNPLMQFYTDPGWAQYAGCKCRPGTWGLPPHCVSVPSSAQLNYAGGFHVPEIGPIFGTLISPDQPNGFSLSVSNYIEVLNSYTSSGDPAAQLNPGAASALYLPTNTTDTEPQVSFKPLAFSDAWYGDNRLTVGILTNWMVNLTSGAEVLSFKLLWSPGDVTPQPILQTTDAALIRLRTSNGKIYEVSHSPEIIRSHVLQIWLNRAYFTSSGDLLSIYEGDAQRGGIRVELISGDDDIDSVTLSLESARAQQLLSSPAYQFGDYGSIIKSMVNPRLLEVQMLTSFSTINFLSRTEGGQHFFATYDWSSTCPNGYFYDERMDKCRADLVPYHIDEGIRGAVYATTGLSLLWILLLAALMVLAWESAVVRAASRSFLLLMLVLLAALSCGALLHAAIPSYDTVGSGTSWTQAELICHSRAWLCALPLTAILAVLLAKTNRVSSIFGSNKLVLRRVTDGDLLRTVLCLSAVTIVFLICFSALRLTWPDLVEGTGNRAGYAIPQCSVKGTSFAIWISFLLAYMCCLGVYAAFLAFKTRDLPSAYNESKQLFMALIVLILFGFIIVPLVAFVRDAPEAAVFLQGVGQNLMAFLLTTIIFAPKAYILLCRRKEDQRSVVRTSSSDLSSDKTSTKTAAIEFNDKLRPSPEAYHAAAAAAVAAAALQQQHPQLILHPAHAAQLANGYSSSPNELAARIAMVPTAAQLHSLRLQLQQHQQQLQQQRQQQQQQQQHAGVANGVSPNSGAPSSPQMMIAPGVYAASSRATPAPGPLHDSHPSQLSQLLGSGVPQSMFYTGTGQNSSSLPAPQMTPVGAQQSETEQQSTPIRQEASSNKQTLRCSTTEKEQLAKPSAQHATHSAPESQLSQCATPRSPYRGIRLHVPLTIGEELQAAIAAAANAAVKHHQQQLQQHAHEASTESSSVSTASAPSGMLRSKEQASAASGTPQLGNEATEMKA